ncbi:hypothetical protein [Vogesella sp. LIG4]|uniref:hypothetical protein n=1 Tax=Vogesella sp. LIG4 TaxID=1192162 RepID=UPI0013905149|nr:hypothetical protein [Vogesella sp. LIG4]
MNKLFMTVFLLGALSGCAEMPQWFPNSHNQQPRSSNAADTLLAEADRLADRVGKGELTRVQAAEKLGETRIRLVGRNFMDDDVYRLYYQIAQLRDAGKIDGDAARKQMEDRLRYWQRRWPGLQNKPANPAFTQFMFKVYNLPPLK